MSGALARPNRAGVHTFVRSSEALCRVGAFGVVLLGRRTPDPVTIAGPGRQLWEVLRVARTEAEIVDELAACFDADPRAILADIQPVLVGLVELGLVEATE